MRSLQIMSKANHPKEALWENQTKVLRKGGNSWFVRCVENHFRLNIFWNIICMKYFTRRRDTLNVLSVERSSPLRLIWRDIKWSTRERNLTDVNNVEKHSHRMFRLSNTSEFTQEKGHTYVLSVVNHLQLIPILKHIKKYTGKSVHCGKKFKRGDAYKDR